LAPGRGPRMPGANVTGPLPTSSSMRKTALLLRPLLVLLLACLTLPAMAAAEPGLDEGRTQLERISARVDTYEDDAALAQARETVLQIQSAAQALSDSRTPELQSLDARLAELGEVAEGQEEARDVTRERQALQEQR